MCMQMTWYRMAMGRAIQIRDVPEDVHQTLRARAAAAGMSLSDYLLKEVTRLADRPPVADVLARASSRFGGAKPAHVVRAIRSGRDRA